MIQQAHSAIRSAEAAIAAGNIGDAIDYALAAYGFAAAAAEAGLEAEAIPVLEDVRNFFHGIAGN